MLEFILVRQVILVAGCLLGTYTDLKQGLILDKITYPMIAAGLVLNLFEPRFLEYFLLAGIVFTAGYLLYFYGKVGGGDVKLFTAIALLLPVLNTMPFVLNVLFFSALTSIIFLGAYYALP
jgi:preflagellin peptidase FlaK